MLHTPFYDPEKSYEENYEKGPFGAFADKTVYIEKTEPKVNFLGQKINTPFGIAAGPVLNSRFVTAAFEKGFDLVVYKTVRSGVFPCHPFPNVLHVDTKGDLTPQKAQNPLIADSNFIEPLSITNSFGVPSKSVETWQEDARKAVEFAGLGQTLIMSFMGTVSEEQTQQDFIDDFAKVGGLAKETGAKILEVNLSCPNLGNEGLVCYNLETTKNALKAIRNSIGNTPLLVKIGYFEDKNQLKKLFEIVSEYGNGIVAINTIAAPIVNSSGEQALPGGPIRLKSGVCGAGIKWACLDMVRRLSELNSAANSKLAIVGVGGVMNVDDYHEVRRAGADAVMSATGAMWNPYLAQEVKATLTR